MRVSKKQGNKSQDPGVNASELAKAIKVSRKTLYQWMKLEGAPKANAGRFNVAEWEAFVVSMSLGEKRESTAQTLDMPLLKAQKLAVEIEARRHALDVRKEKYMLSSEVESDWIARIAKLKQILVSKFEMELPPLYVGKTAPENMMLNRKAIFDALTAAGKCNSANS